MTPFQVYQQQILEKSLQLDPQQALVMQQLQTLYEELLLSKKWLLTKIKPTIQGVYCWGPVGRGKTHLMDLFYNNLNLPKLRYHFHEFMQHIHAELTLCQGQTNPLKHIAKQLRKKAKVLCLDEFLVHEIGDAMLLAQLLAALFEQGFILVTTANTAPDDLYRHGLQRDRFLPAIELIKKHLRIIHLNSPIDYRRPTTFAENSYPLLIMNKQQLQQFFNELTQKNMVTHQALFINGRPIPHLGCTDKLIWFDFNSICAVPRSQRDYLVIAKHYSTILISNLRPISESDDNTARLFIHLIDILYEAKCKLILSSFAPITDIYPKGRFIAEFARTKSRLAAFSKSMLNYFNPGSST